MPHRPKRFYRHMNPQMADLMRELYFVGKIKQAQLAKAFGLAQGSVSRTISGQVWNSTEQTPRS